MNIKGISIYKPGLLLLPVLAFALFGWVFDYVFIVERDLPCCFFLFGRAFLGEFTDHPGGLLTWAGRFVCQFSHTTWLGALVLASCVSLFGLLLHLVLTKRGGPFCLIGLYVPCVLLLILHTLTLRVLMDTIGLVIMCAAFLGYLWISGATARRFYAALLTPVLYVAVGGYVWLFVLWVTAVEWADNKLHAGLAFKVLYPMVALGMPFAAYRWIFPVSLQSAFAHNPIFVSALPHAYVVIVAFLYGYLLVMPFWPSVVNRIKQLRSRHWKAFCQGKTLPRLTLLALVLIAALLSYRFYNPACRELADYISLYQAADWDGILTRAHKKSSSLLLAQFLVNRALYEKGRLLDDMFCYPQRGGTGGLVLQPAAMALAHGSGDADSVLAMYNSDLFFKMGHITMAYRQAYDQLSKIGPTCRSYKRMAECHMANGRYEAARKYLALLEKTLFHRGFAHRCQAILDDTAASKAFVAEAGAQRPLIALHTISFPWTGLLELVASGHENRMALEYLTAWRLLDKGSIPLIAGELGFFKEAGYVRLPRHVQEALFLHEVTTGQPVNKQGFSYDDTITRRFREFDLNLTAVQGNPAAQRSLWKEFGDTYLLYFITDKSPAYHDETTCQHIGHVFLSKGMADRAILYYRLALQYKPSHTGIRNDLTEALAVANKQKERTADSDQKVRTVVPPPAEAKKTPELSTREAQVEK